MFALRKEDGLKLYARKVLIQEYCRDLLPEYLRFVQGIVDSEDIPLNVSRETVQASRVMPQLKRIVTGKAIDMLKEFAASNPDGYAKFWKDFYRFIKEGIATDRENGDNLSPLLRYFSLNHPGEVISLDQYIAEMKSSQTRIFYILGDDPRSSARSPHLDIFRKQGVDVLLMTDPLDSFVLLALTAYKEHPLSSAAAEKPDLEPDQEQNEETSEAGDNDQNNVLLERFRQRLGEQISDVRLTDRLLDSPARLVDKEGSMQQEVQRVYRMLKQEYEAPKKVLELNPKHELIMLISHRDAADLLSDLAIDQVYENALLIEGLHPDPAGMIDRIQKILMSALK
jgi:molecular chaperone HtpG